MKGGAQAFIDSFASIGALDPRCARFKHTPAGIPGTRYDGTGRPVVFHTAQVEVAPGVLSDVVVAAEQPLFRAPSSRGWRPPAGKPCTRYWLPGSGELHLYHDSTPAYRQHQLERHPGAVLIPDDHNPMIDEWTYNDDSGCLLYIEQGREGEYARQMLLKHHPNATVRSSRLRHPGRPHRPLFDEDMQASAVAA